MSYDTGATSSQQYRLQRSTFLSPPLPSAPPPLSQFLLLLPCQPPPSREVWPETNRLLDFVGKNGCKEWNLVKVTAFFDFPFMVYDKFGSDMCPWLKSIVCQLFSVWWSTYIISKSIMLSTCNFVQFLVAKKARNSQAQLATWETTPLFSARAPSRDALLLVSPNSSYLFAL